MPILAAVGYDGWVVGKAGQDARVRNALLSQTRPGNPETADKENRLGERLNMKLIDVRHPFFNPLYRRVLTVALCLGWAGMEVISGSPFWAILFGAIGVFCAYEFFVIYEPYEDPKQSKRDDENS